MAKHSELTNNHVPYAFAYADATEREAATGFAAADVGKLARQLDDNSLWMLIDDSPETWLQIGGATGGAGAMLAYTSYNPGTGTTVSTTSTTGEDVDATNLSITFTVPASGKVLISLSAGCYTSAGNAYWWCLRTTGGSNVAGTRRRVSSLNGIQMTCVSRVVVTGLTPGASVTYRWGHGISANTGNIRYGDEGTSDPYGPALMEVWAAE